MPRQLVVLTGPIASGKTTVARELATGARRRGQTAAAIDLDDLVQMVKGLAWQSVTHDDWLDAGELAAQIAETLFLRGIETVFLAGPFFTEELRTQLLRGFAIEPPTLFVLLRVSLAESFRRSKADARRLAGLQEPGFLERMYATIDWDRLPAQDVDVETDGQDVAEVVAAVAAQVLA